MAGEGFEVAEGELRTFANSLRGMADKLAGSAGAVRGVSYGITTWGIVGQPFAWATKDKTNDAAGQVDKGATSVRDTATGVDNTAQTYVDTDGSISTRFGGDK
jgi:hypothetical protein